MSQLSILVLIITGPVGAGKSSVALAISDLLNAAERPHALIDMDALRACFPSPPDDPFNMALGLRNLTAVWANYRTMGAERLIVADVVETQADIDGYRRAIPGAAIQVVRLNAKIETLHRRLERRERDDDSLAWHKNRAIELTALMNERGLEDFLIDTDGKTIPEIAREIMTAIGR